MVVQTGYLQHPHAARISVSYNAHLILSILLIFILVWYGNYRNRGYISPDTLQKLGELPFVEERWKLLASELGAWKQQDFDAPNKKV